MYLTAVLFANSAPRGAACRRIELRGTICQRIGDHELINLADVALGSIRKVLLLVETNKQFAQTK